MLTQLVFSLLRDQWHQENGHCRGNMPKIVLPAGFQELKHTFMQPLAT